jgi:two-component system nitrogen regulation sensor histidine kinase NtrY
MTTREKGTGLGLAIVAKIIEQHGGLVELVDAEPDAEGRVGACFAMSLPLRRGREQQEPAAAAETTSQDLRKEEAPPVPAAAD